MRDDKGRFIKGRSSDDEPIETRLKRISSLKESWKKRKDYIGDIRSIHPYIQFMERSNVYFKG